MSIGPTVQGITQEAKRIHEDSIFCYAGHSEEARRWSDGILWLGIPTAVIAALAGVISVSGQSSSSTLLGLNVNLLVGTVSFIVAAMSSLSTFLDPKGRASQHYQACQAYLRLANDARIFYEIDCLKSTNVGELEDRLRKLSARLNDLDGQTPIIPNGAAKVARKTVESGKFAYKVDSGKYTFE